jgi:hypothetical protein
MLFRPGSLSVVACPTQRQSSEAVRRVKDALVAAGATFLSEHVYGHCSSIHGFSAASADPYPQPAWVNSGQVQRVKTIVQGYSSLDAVDEFRIDIQLRVCRIENGGFRNCLSD